MKTSILIRSAVFALWISATPTSAQSIAGSSDSAVKQTIRVITYNVQFLPGPARVMNKRGDPDYRAARIAKEMSAFDIVALQEVFEEKHRQRIVDGIRAAWGDALSILVSPKPSDRITNGGCLLLTRLPIVASHSMIFEHYSTVEEYSLGADGFAAKGVLHARIAMDPGSADHCVDVFATHLEARADHLRLLQFEELAAFIAKHNTLTTPILLLGDLNTKGMLEYRDDPDSQYSTLMQTLDTTTPGTPLQDLWPLLRGKALGGTTEQESADVGKRIDYMIFGNPTLSAIPLKPLSVEVRLYQDERVVALSDHNAVAAEFRWAATRPNKNTSKEK
jgi:endonuclease/exonuclease/phosphatase family metal-dependent hydrolase